MNKKQKSIKLKVWGPRKYVSWIEPVHPESRSLRWKKGELRHCELSHIVHMNSNPLKIIVEFHLTPRGIVETKRRDRLEKLKQKRHERYLKSAAFRRQQQEAFDAYVSSW